MPGLEVGSFNPAPRHRTYGTALLGQSPSFALAFLLESAVKGDEWNPEPSLELPPLELARTLTRILYSKLAAVKPDFPVRSGNPVPTSS